MISLLPIYGDGKQQRDWLHVEDNCRGILAVLERGRIGEVYNLGGVDIEENLSMAQRLLRVMGKPETLLSLRERSPRSRSPLRTSNAAKWSANLGWKPSIPLDEGLRQTIDWYRSNPNGWPESVAEIIVLITKSIMRIAIRLSTRSHIQRSQASPLIPGCVIPGFRSRACKPFVAIRPETVRKGLSL